MKKYIDFKTELRAKVKNNFDKDFSKLTDHSFLEKQWEMYENKEISNS